MSWSSFDEGAFVAELERILDAASGASDALLALVRAGPTRPERISGGFWEPEAEPASEAAEMAKVALGQANVLLRGLDKEDDEDSPAPLRAKLGPFFADGRHAVESGQPPPELVQRIYGRVFHRPWPSEAPNEANGAAFDFTWDMMTDPLAVALERSGPWRRRLHAQMMEGIAGTRREIPSLWLEEMVRKLLDSVTAAKRRHEVGTPITNLWGIAAYLFKAVMHSEREACFRITFDSLTPATDCCDRCGRAEGDRAHWPEQEHKATCVPREDK
ncbi:hypothetical protein DFJ74DRAFT_706234 [Hyaloraphidium curvatum]|nr:hypothetical protein DFJ74DRAFT_706234 [Hyaloraphidium curvatum]